MTCRRCDDTWWIDGVDTRTVHRRSERVEAADREPRPCDDHDGCVVVLVDYDVAIRCPVCCPAPVVVPTPPMDDEPRMPMWWNND